MDSNWPSCVGVAFSPEITGRAETRSDEEDGSRPDILFEERFDPMGTPGSAGELASHSLPDSRRAWGYTRQTDCIPEPWVAKEHHEVYEYNEPISCETGVRNYRQLYDLLVSQLQEFAIFMLDTSGCLATWNEGVQRVTGFPESEFLGKSAEILFTPEDRARGVPQQEIATAAREGRAADERWHIRKDGTRFFCDGLMTAVRGTDGSILGFAKIMRDVTGRKRLEEEFEDVRQAIEQAQVLVRDFDGSIRFWTAGAEALYGFTRDEAIGRISHELLHTRFPRALEEINAALKANGRWEGELWHLRKDGGSIAVRSDWTMHQVRDGWIVVESNSDITERKAVEEKLRTSEERHRKAFTHVPVGMAITGADGRILFVNPAYCEIVGYTAAELTNKSFLSLTHPEDVPENRELHRQLLAGEVPSFVMEKRYIRKDGQTIWVRASATVLREEAGEPVQVVGTIENIQARKDSEARLLQANEELSRFAHVVAHDLQSPLRGVRTFAELLEKRYAGTLDKTGREFVRFILDGTTTMDELIAALLRYASAGGEALDRSPVQVQSVIDAVATVLQPLMADTRAELTRESLPTVIGDRIQLIQLFQNLVMNAIKYRKIAEAPRIHVSARLQAREWVISVADNGQGIPAEYYGEIFEPLKRLHGRNVPGTGMGLSVCQRIVESHGGRIWVESQPGQGSTFSFTLPGADAELNP